MEELNFAKRVKNELANNFYSVQQKKYILSGFIRNGGVFTLSKIPQLTLKTELAAVAKLLFNCLKDVYDLDVEIKYEEKIKFNKGIVFNVNVSSERLYQILEDLEILKDGYERLTPNEGLHKKNLQYLCIGCFLANGSVNNPKTSKTSYFLEMAFTSLNDANAILKKLNEYKEEKTMTFKYIQRRDKHVLYIKKSDQISVFLSYIGAIEAMFEFENARIQKEDLNISNRLTICDTANYKKTIDRAKQDIEDIDYLLKFVPINNLDLKTQKVIEIRKKFPDYNYRELADELCENYSIEITKSGIVHILMNIREKVEKLKAENNKNN